MDCSWLCSISSLSWPHHGALVPSMPSIFPSQIITTCCPKAALWLQSATIILGLSSMITHKCSRQRCSCIWWSLQQAPVFLSQAQRGAHASCRTTVHLLQKHRQRQQMTDQAQ